LALTALMFRENATFQLSIALLFMFAAFVFQAVKQPYWSIEEQAEHVRKLAEKRTKEREDEEVLTKAVMHINTQQRRNPTRVKKGIAGAEEGLAKQGSRNILSLHPKKIMDENIGEIQDVHHEEKKVMEAAKSVVFNLNTIEQFTLASTVLVNLSGIMLLSGQFESSPDYQTDLITYTILFLIFVSFFYLGTAFLREIMFARTIGRSFTKARWRAAIQKQIDVNKKKRKNVQRFQDVVYAVMRKNNIGEYAKSSWIAPEDRKNVSATTKKVKTGKLFGFKGSGRKVSAVRPEPLPHASNQRTRISKVDLTSGDEIDCTRAATRTSRLTKIDLVSGDEVVSKELSMERVEEL